MSYKKFPELKRGDKFPDENNRINEDNSVETRNEFFPGIENKKKSDKNQPLYVHQLADGFME